LLFRFLVFFLLFFFGQLRFLAFLASPPDLDIDLRNYISPPPPSGSWEMTLSIQVLVSVWRCEVMSGAPSSSSPPLSSIMPRPSPELAL